MTSHRLFLLGIALTSAVSPGRLAAQDTTAIDRGVRIGIVYRPGVRPGVVVLPGRQVATGLDSVRAIVSRDLDYSDRLEVITLPGGDSVRGSTTMPARPDPAGRGARPRPAAGGARSTIHYIGRSARISRSTSGARRIRR